MTFMRKRSSIEVGMIFSRLIILVAVFGGIMPIRAQKESKVYTVEGTYIGMIPPYMTYNQAKQDAIIKAQNQAIENKFHTTNTSQVTSVVSNKDGQSSVFTQGVFEGIVRGVWLGNLDEPKIERIQKGDEDWLKVTVKGRARKLTGAGIEFEAEPLRYKPDRELKALDFKNGDNFYLYFKSPVDGFLNVFMFDIASNMVICLLPYQKSGSGAYSITHDEEYFFFAPQKAKPGDGEVNEPIMICSEGNQEEFNELYVVFSPEYFAKGNTKIVEKRLSEDLMVPPAMDYLDFNKWLIQNQEKDEKMQLLRMTLHVSNR